MNKKKKILLCTSVFPPDSGGVSAFAKDIYTMFDESNDYEVSLYYTGKEKKNKKRLDAYFSSFRKSYNLLKHISKKKPDVIICTAIIPYVPILTKFKIFLGYKLIVQVMGTEIAGKFNEGLRKYIQAKNFNKCDFVWPISNYTKKLLEEYGVKESILHTFYPFVTNEMINTAESLEKGDKHRTFTIFTSAHLYPRKGIDIVLNAIAGLKELDIEYHIAGKVPSFKQEYEGYYQKMAGDLGIENQVIFLGQLDRKQLWNLLSKSHLFVMQSRAYKDDIESFGIVYMEAQLFGLPCIGTNYGGIPEAIATEQGGILVENEDVEGLKKAIKLMYEDKEYRNKTSVESKRYVIRNFSQNVRLLEVSNLFNNKLD